MLTATLQAGLDAYTIGPKLRALRLKKKMGLVELGRHTGLSSAMLSKIERGRLFPTLPTLLRIALVFGVGLDFFFVGARDDLSSVSCDVGNGCAFRTNRRPGSRRSSSNRSTSPRTIVASTPTWRTFSRCQSRGSERTNTLAVNSSTCCAGRSAFTLEPTSTCSRPRTRSTSTVRCRTDTAAAAVAPAPRSS